MPEPFEGIPAVDRVGIEVLNEVSDAIRRAVAAVRSDPALGRLIAERSPQLADLVPDVVRVALRTVVPPIIEQHEAERLQLQRQAIGADHITEEMVLAARSTIHVASGKRIRTDVVRLALVAALAPAGGESRG